MAVSLFFRHLLFIPKIESPSEVAKTSEGLIWPRVFSGKNYLVYRFTFTFGAGASSAVYFGGPTTR